MTHNRRAFLGCCLAGVPLCAQARAAGSAPLLIRRIDPHVLRIGSRANIVCARLETSEGIHGWGEGTTPPAIAPILAQLEELKSVVLGQSAWDIEKLWHRMYVAGENFLGGTLYSAMSIIDTALYDILGKHLNVPVYKLLGGKVHDRLRIYTSYRWGNIPRTAEAYTRRTRELVSQGATAGKYDPFGAYPGPERQLPTPTLLEVREMIRGIREGGPQFDICVEAHGKFNLASAGRIVKMLEPFDPFFIEEPVPVEDVDAMAALQRSTNIPIATGEGLYTHFGFREVLNKQAARILQPDVARAGGITAVKKIASMAQSHYVTIAPHNPNGPVCTAASIHLAASIPNFLIMEEGGGYNERAVYQSVFAGGWSPDSGWWAVPESPGLGVDFSPQFLKEYGVRKGN
jgi:galactonate dehydratase